MPVTPMSVDHTTWADSSSVEYSDAYSLRIGSSNYLLNQTAELIQYVKCWCTFNDVDFSKQNVKSELNFIGCIRRTINYAEYCFVIFRVPNRWEAHGMTKTIAAEVDHHLTARQAMSNGDNSAMLVAIRNFIECPEKVVSAEIRLKAPENIKYFLRIVPAVSISEIVALIH